jgi:hypothetical protein
MIDPERYEYWTCTIGPVQRKEIAFGGDGPLRCAVQDKFFEMFGEQEMRCSSGWGLTPDVEGVLSQIRMLNTTDPSGETFQKIVKALAENTARLKEMGL